MVTLNQHIFLKRSITASSNSNYFYLPSITAGSSGDLKTVTITGKSTSSSTFV
ncbi:MAG: hypothetical protein IPO63_07710 [Bacteroidetes bacterium]|nr:hypothetical protein [Bacteroidota bacterium]